MKLKKVYILYCCLAIIMFFAIIGIHLLSNESKAEKIPIAYTIKPKSSDKISIRLDSNELVDMQMINTSPNQPLIWKPFKGYEPKGNLVLSGIVAVDKQYDVKSFNSHLDTGAYTFLFYNEDGSNLSGMLEFEDVVSTDIY